MAVVPLPMQDAPAGLVEIADEDPVHLDRRPRAVPEGHAPVRHPAVTRHRDRPHFRPELGRDAALHPGSNDRVPPACQQPARGITGGISNDVTYLGTEPGSSVPPGIWANAVAAPVPGSRPNR